MDVVVDANIFLAVILNEPEKESIIALSKSFELISPEVLPYEIGNALTAMYKRNRLNETEILKAFSIFKQIPVRCLAVDIEKALKIASDNSIYAYDAYYLEASKRMHLPLMTLDKKMKDVAEMLGIQVLEVI